MKINLMAISASALIGLSLGATLVFADVNAGTGIVGSSHDMNKFSSNDPYGRVCAFCHTPHHAIPVGTDGADYLPLWSHQLTQQNYTKYDSSSMVADISDPLTGPTRLCMSCHDGVIAIDQHYGGTGTLVAPPGRTGDLFDSTGKMKKGGISVGVNGDLSNDHPVGFLYDDVVAKMPNDIFSSDHVFTNNIAGKKISDCLTNGYMTCATCHDVHNKDNVADAGNTYNYFLYSPEMGSQICLSCHNK